MKTLFFIGTSTDAVTLAPLIMEFRKYNELFNVRVCVLTDLQAHDRVLDYFGINPDFDIDIKKKNQDNFDIITKSMTGIRKIINTCRPDYLIIQGEKTTAFAGALAAFYEKVGVVHIDIGPRDSGRYLSFPEEMNKAFISKIADLLFVPTTHARENLLKEAIHENKIHVVGHTGIDALFQCLEKVGNKGQEEFSDLNAINFNKRVILVTGFESYNIKTFENICHALKTIAERNGVEIVYHYPLNSNERKNVIKIVNSQESLHLIEALDYPSLVWLMNKSYLIITDSENVREMAPSVGKPILVAKDVVGRAEDVAAGVSRIVGTNPGIIVSETINLLDNKSDYKRMSEIVNPYGDGMACARIRKVFAENCYGIHKANNGTLKNSRNHPKMK